MSLFANRIGFSQPRDELEVDVRRRGDVKVGHVIARRERLDLVKARMLESPGQHHVAIQTVTPRRHLGK